MLYHQNQLHDIRLDLENNRIVFLYGDLGAGKTSLIRSIFRNQLSITSEVTSPTYSYYNKYQDDTYHFDLYRLEKYDEFFAIAGEDIIDSGALCFIEWPELLEKHYKADIEIHITKTDDENVRDISIIYSS